MIVKGLCAKQTTIAIITNGNRAFIGTNWVNNPQEECPRKDMPSGQGYEMCREICVQHAHAEVDACEQAGEYAKGATLYLIGHTYCCANCLQIMKKYKIKEVKYCEYSPHIPMETLVISY